DPQAPLAIRGHAAADVVGDPLPGRRVAEEHGVGLDVLGRWLEPAVDPVYDEVPGSERLDEEPDPGAGAGDVDHRAVEGIDGGGEGARGRAAGERGVVDGRFAHRFPEIRSLYPRGMLTERRGARSITPIQCGWRDSNPHALNEQ